MKGFDTLHVKSAVRARNKMDLSRSHLTTMDFGEIVPLFCEETVPGDKFNVSADFFSRMAPLVKPTYGKFSFKTVSAFVPYHQIAYDVDAWMAGKTSFEGQTPTSRYITISQLADFIRQHCCTSTGASATNCDFSFLSNTGNVTYMVFTTQGKYWVKILNALGYAVPQGVDYQTTSDWYITIRIKKLSAYPLLSFFKVYNDYMSQSQRFNTSALSDFLLKVKQGIAISGSYTPSTGSITYTGMKTLFDNLLLNYENDYFTSAWQNPNCALTSPENVNTLDVPQFPATISGSNNDNVIAQSVPVSSGFGALSLGQRALDFLRSFDDWVRRNNYSGSRSVQQIYSRFGIKTDDYRSHYAHIISTDSLPIQVGDVTASADTSGASLGSYAGKGVMSGNNGFNIEVSDYGMLFVLGYYTVTPMNPYGFSRTVLRSEPLDYYNPEFDGLGADAIPLMEVYENPLGVADSDTTRSDSIFGFTERYNSYRYGRDLITGEFRDYRNNGIMNVWHTGRNLSAIRKAGSLVAQSSSMNTLPQIDSEYNRIFSVTSGNVNHFYMTARFNVSAVRPMMSLNQVANLGEGDTVVPRNGNIIA